MANQAGAQLQGFWNRPVLRAFALAGLVLLVGSWIPLPGLAPADPPISAEAASAMARWSVLMLGLQPVLSVLIVVELLTLLVPRFDRWIADPSDGLLRPRPSIVALALLLAAYQGIGIHEALSVAGFAGTDAISRSVIVATLMAGTATLLFLAERLLVSGLAFGGFWLVLSIPGMETLAFAFTDLIAQFRIETIRGDDVVLGLSLVGAAVASIIVSATVLREHAGASGDDRVRWSRLLVWPPILAEALSTVVAEMAEGVLPGDPSALPSRVSMVWTLCLCITLPVVVHLYANAMTRTGRGAPARPGRRVVLGLLAGVQIAICGGFALLSEVWATFPVKGSALIVVVVVVSTAHRVGRPSAADAWHGPQA